MLWMAFQTGQAVDSVGSGPLAYSIVFGRQRRSWTLPRGGSGQLARALVEVIEQGGGDMICDQRVVDLIVSDGRCVGVVTQDGTRHLARPGGAVDDPRQGSGADGSSGRLGRGLRLRDRDLRRGHLGVRRPLRDDRGATLCDRDGGEIEVVSAGVAGWGADIRRMGRDVREGRVVRDGAWLLFPAPTVADPTRAPDGHHTVKILGMQPYQPAVAPVARTRRSPGGSSGRRSRRSISAISVAPRRT